MTTRHDVLPLDWERWSEAEREVWYEKEETYELADAAIERLSHSLTPWQRDLLVTIQDRLNEAASFERDLAAQRLKRAFPPLADLADYWVGWTGHGPAPHDQLRVVSP